MRLFRNRRGSNTREANAPQASNSNEFLHQSEALIPAEVRMISGCHSEQTSADVSNVGSVAQLPDPAGRAGGACTSALLNILYNSAKALTFQDLLLKLRESLASTGFEQIPQLTSSRPLEMKQTPFHLVGGNGARRALLVGINYRGQNGQLSGCHNDCFNMKKYIMQLHGFPEQNITVLVDDGNHLYPTRQKIIAALRQLVAQSRAGDSVYFHYSGHGGLLMPQGNAYKINNHDHDETLYPVDHERSGQIRDFSLFNHFVKPMAAGVTVTCVMDCCHSGAVLDLPYSFRPTDSGTIRMRENMSSLSNLAFLYILAGGILPHGFDNVAEHLGETVDGDLDDYQGTGIEEDAENDFGADGYQDYDPQDDGYQDYAGEDMAAPEYGSPEDGFTSPEYADTDGVVVPGIPAQDGDFSGYSEGVVVPGIPAQDGDYGIADGVIVPGVAVPEDSDRGYGDIGGYDYQEAGGDDGVDDVDCGCVQDILGSLLEGDEF